MRISPAKSGAPAFLAMFKKTMKETTITEISDPSRLYFLRCSQLPYCPRSVLMKWASTGLEFEMDMLMNYYVHVGHSVHSTMQSYLGLSGQLVADYNCRKCGKWYRFSTKSRCCGQPCAYHEVQIDYKGIKGHIDAIFKVGDRYYIVDFKTTSLAGSRTKKTKPGQGYTHQVRAYAYLMWKQYKVRASGVMLVFLPRDNPRQPVIWEEQVTDESLERTRKQLRHDRSLHKKTMGAKTVEDFKDLLTNNCGGQYCAACKTPTPGLLRLLKEQRKQFPIKKKE